MKERKTKNCTEAQQVSVCALCLMKEVTQVQYLKLQYDFRYCLFIWLCLNVVYIVLSICIFPFAVFTHLCICLFVFYSLRKKPNERPAYTELMVSNFFSSFYQPKTPANMMLMLFYYQHPHWNVQYGSWFCPPEARLTQLNHQHSVCVCVFSQLNIKGTN